MKILGGKEQYVLGEEQRDLRDAQKRRAENAWAMIRTMTHYRIGATVRTVFVDASAGAVSVYLPVVSQHLPVTIKKVDTSANAVTVYPVGSAKVERAASLSLTLDGQAVVLLNDGTDWQKIGEVAGA